MATKKVVSVDTIREEMRVLNAAATDVAATDMTNWLTPEFWTMAATALANLVAVAVMIGWVDQTQAQDITKAVSALVGATQVLVLNTVLVFKYLTQRQQLKVEAMRAKYDYVTAVTIEKMRAERGS
jgi:anti-sigma-K factor RskA